MQVQQKILIVEDELFTAEAIKELLVRLNYEPIDETAISYDTALALTAKYQPDLILMDIMIEGDKTGIDAAEYISRNYDIPIVFLTAYSDDENMESALKTQPFGYIVKPITDEMDLKPNLLFALSSHNFRQEEHRLAQKAKRIEKLLGEENPADLEADMESIQNGNGRKLSLRERANIQISIIKLDKLSDKELLNITQFYSVLANSVRIKILDTIIHEHNFFDEIASDIGKSNATTSHHLSSLEEFHFIRVIREGNRTRYLFNREDFSNLLEKLKTQDLSSLEQSFFALSNFERVKMLQFFEKQNGTSLDLQKIIDKSSTSISRHLSVLHENNLLVIQKNQKPIEYKLNQGKLAEILSDYKE